MPTITQNTLNTMDYIYKASNRRATQVQPKNGKTYTLEELQDIVGDVLICNENSIE